MSPRSPVRWPLRFPLSHFTSLFLHPHVQILCSVLLMAAAQVLLKRGADATASASWLGVAALRSGWVWLGIVAMIGSLLSWLHALRFVQLSVAYNLSGLLHVIVPLSCWIFLSEEIGGRRWLGIALVLAGVLITAKPAGKIEEEIEAEIEHIEPRTGPRT
jgi:drug/metabolite transporter (DMT)-like permease